RALAIGRGPNPELAAARADSALAWLAEPRTRPAPGRLASSAAAAVDDAAYAEAVGRIIARIAAGEIFQANLARAWRGRLAPGVRPFDVFARLSAQSPAGYAAFLNLPGRALVSNSPEQFLSVRPQGGGLWVESRPIKGTRPRGTAPADDAAPPAHPN